MPQTTRRTPAGRTPEPPDPRPTWHDDIAAVTLSCRCGEILWESHWWPAVGANVWDVHGRVTVKAVAPAPRFTLP